MLLYFYQADMARNQLPAVVVESPEDVACRFCHEVEGINSSDELIQPWYYTCTLNYYKRGPRSCSLSLTLVSQVLFFFFSCFRGVVW